MENYIMEQLQAGRSIEEIGNAFAAALNAANETILQKKEEAEKAARRAELIDGIIGSVQELAILEGVPEEEISITDEEYDEMAEQISDFVVDFIDSIHFFREHAEDFAAIKDVIDSWLV
jgi:hypothetical protein